MDEYKRKLIWGGESPEREVDSAGTAEYFMHNTKYVQLEHLKVTG
jgi:hypothetical protein